LTWLASGLSLAACTDQRFLLFKSRDPISGNDPAAVMDDPLAGQREENVLLAGDNDGVEGQTASGEESAHKIIPDDEIDRLVGLPIQDPLQNNNQQLVTDIKDEAPVVASSGTQTLVIPATGAVSAEMLTGYSFIYTDADSAQADLTVTISDSRFGVAAGSASSHLAVNKGAVFKHGEILPITVTVRDAENNSGSVTFDVKIGADPILDSGTIFGEAFEDSLTPASDLFFALDQEDSFAGIPLTFSIEARPGETEYGTFTIAPGGRWTFHVDNANADVDALNHDEQLTTRYIVTVTDSDGYTNAMELAFSIIGRTDITGTTGDDTLTGYIGLETIKGGNGNDTITTGGGSDIVIGGHGKDVITLDPKSSASIIHRFESTGDDGWTLRDGGDRINNFRPLVDKLILVDSKASGAINDYDTWLAKAFTQITGGSSNLVTVTATIADTGALDGKITGLEFGFTHAGKTQGDSGADAGSILQINFYTSAPAGLPDYDASKFTAINNNKAMLTAADFLDDIFGGYLDVTDDPGIHNI